jgi:hypothetical protein
MVEKTFKLKTSNVKIVFMIENISIFSLLSIKILKYFSFQN